jgi:hypothetical protein
MMDIPPENPQDKFTLAIRCHWCGHTGLSMWAVSEAGRQAVNPDNFYERVASRDLRLSKFETICNNCDRPQPI